MTSLAHEVTAVTKTVTVFVRHQMEATQISNTWCLVSQLKHADISYVCGCRPGFVARQEQVWGWHQLRHGAGLRNVIKVQQITVHLIKKCTMQKKIFKYLFEIILC